MKLLFIGNSHTYFNDMPAMVQKLLEGTGEKTHVTMLTRGGQPLTYHCDEQSTRFNIRYGRYDAVIAQDRASDFDAEQFCIGAERLLKMTTEAGVPLILYMPWVSREHRERQKVMTYAYASFCRRNRCALAPAGEVFSRLLQTTSADVLYYEDGAHASVAGSYAAAVTLFYALTGRRRIMAVKPESDPGVAAGLSPDLCRQIHTEACRVVRLFNG